METPQNQTKRLYGFLMEFPKAMAAINQLEEKHHDIEMVLIGKSEIESVEALTDLHHNKEKWLAEGNILVKKNNEPVGVVTPQGEILEVTDGTETSQGH